MTRIATWEDEGDNLIGWRFVMKRTRKNAVTAIIMIIIVIIITMMMMMIVFQQTIKCVQGGDS